MAILLVLLAVFCTWKLEFGYYPDFLSPSNTLSIKGIFVFFVLFAHMQGYLTLSDSLLNNIYFSLQNHLRQLIVAMFLFYSGYGIWISSKQKANYTQSFFKRRVLKTLLHFDLIVAVFLIVQLLLQNAFPLRNYFLCWIGWDSIGNSNWFIFDILILYIIARIALYCQKKFGQGGICITILLTGCFWLFLRRAGKENWWVDTLSAFPLGMLIANYSALLKKLLAKKGMPYIFTGLSLLLFVISYKILGGVDVFGFTTCTFCLLVVMLSSWIKVGNPILNWAGKNVFTVYMLQRLPMLVLTAAGINKNPVLFVIASCCLTFLLAESFSWLLKWVDQKLFNA